MFFSIISFWLNDSQWSHITHHLHLHPRFNCNQAKVWGPKDPPAYVTCNAANSKFIKWRPISLCFISFSHILFCAKRKKSKQRMMKQRKQKDSKLTFWGGIWKRKKDVRDFFAKRPRFILNHLHHSGSLGIFLKNRFFLLRGSIYLLDLAVHMLISGTQSYHCPKFETVRKQHYFLFKFSWNFVQELNTSYPCTRDDHP